MKAIHIPRRDNPSARGLLVDRLRRLEEHATYPSQFARRKRRLLTMRLVLRGKTWTVVAKVDSGWHITTYRFRLHGPVMRTFQGCDPKPIGSWSSGARWLVSELMLIARRERWESNHKMDHLARLRKTLREDRA